jgi:hypothetical protein
MVLEMDIDKVSWDLLEYASFQWIGYSLHEINKIA